MESNTAALGSLPTRGEWVEILPEHEKQDRRRGLSPHGESGLKLLKFCCMLHVSTSLPTRGEWVEIYNVRYMVWTVYVSPHTGRVG